MRPMPNVDNDTEEEQSTIDLLVEETFKEMRLGGHEGHVDSAAKSAMKRLTAQAKVRIPEDEWDDTKAEIKQRVNETLPDEFEYELDYDLDEGYVLHVSSGCPNCGNEEIFNGTLMTSNQWVGSGETDEYTVCRIDDCTRQKIEFLACGTCPEVLVDEREAQK